MLCEQCKQREATTHIQRVINGAAEEFHLCGACAREAGLVNLAPNFGFHLSDLFSGFLGMQQGAQEAQRSDGARCEFCGSSLREITQSGRVGCAQCYDTFYTALEPALQRIHGSLEHAGKTPEADPAAQGRRQAERRAAQLREEIAAAVREENYELAAKLRDEIRTLEEGGNGNAVQ